MTERAAAIAMTVRRAGFWLGELQSQDIQDLRAAGFTVRVIGRALHGWDCEVSR